MDERAWAACGDPKKMLEFLLVSEQTTERKLRLYAAACCRRVWACILRQGHRVVESVELLADGRVSRDETERVLRRSRLLPGWQENMSLDSWVGIRRLLRACNRAENATEAAVLLAAEAVVGSAGIGSLTEPAKVAEDWSRWLGSLRQSLKRGQRSAVQRSQSATLRDIFGPLPFCPMAPLPPSVFQWNGGLIQRLAEAAYEHRILPAGHLDPERLGVLADALEDAGAEAEMVEHLRGPGPHVRGCAVVDLLTGQE